MILTSNGTPFETERAAKMRAGILSKEGTEAEAVAVEGGYALKVIAKETRKRVPLVKRNILTSRPQTGYVQRFVTDTEDRIERFIEAGWEVVKNEQVGDNRAGKDTPVGSATTKAVGSGRTAILMRKRKDWYDEDYNAKMKIVDRSEEGLVRQAAQGRYGKI